MTRQTSVSYDRHWIFFAVVHFIVISSLSGFLIIVGQLASALYSFGNNSSRPAAWWLLFLASTLLITFTLCSYIRTRYTRLLVTTISSFVLIFTLIVLPEFIFYRTFDGDLLSLGTPIPWLLLYLSVISSYIFSIRPKLITYPDES
jgi:hypothetical protein